MIFTSTGISNFDFSSVTESGHPSVSSNLLKVSEICGHSSYSSIIPSWSRSESRREKASPEKIVNDKLKIAIMENKLIKEDIFLISNHKKDFFVV